MINKLNEFMKEKIEKINCHNLIKEAMIYTLISEGKLLRPQMFLYSIEEKSRNKYFDIAMALECVHTYSLIHDDLPSMDNDNFRRGKETCHIKFGEDIAILTGDALLTLSFDLIANSNLSDEKKIEIVKILSKKSGADQGMINGQVLDIKANDNISINLLDNIYIQKTSKLIEASLVIANVITENNDETILIILSKEIGLLYQIKDDYLDLYGEFEETGKIIGSDLINNKKTYTNFYKQNELEKIIIKKQNEVNKKINKLNNSEELKEILMSLYNRRK